VVAVSAVVWLQEALLLLAVWPGLCGTPEVFCQAEAVIKVAEAEAGDKVTAEGWGGQWVALFLLGCNVTAICVLRSSRRLLAVVNLVGLVINSIGRVQGVFK